MRKKLNDAISDPGLRASLEKRFWRKVDVGGEAECWPWVAKAKHRFGYGVIQGVPGAGTFNAHCVAWALTNGQIPDGAFILHTCDVPGCCNPNHLYAGTASQNIIDRNSRGRRNYAGHSEEVRQKIRDGYAKNPPKQSQEVRDRKSVEMKRRWQSQEWRERFSEMMSGENNPAFGKTPSAARMEAVIAACKRRKGVFKHSEETKRKMRETWARKKSAA